MIFTGFYAELYSFNVSNVINNRLKSQLYYYTGYVLCGYCSWQCVYDVMVRCEGRPGAACPDGRNDESVKNSQGDLMLCRACEIFRFPYLATSKSAASSLSLTESSVMQSESTSTAVPAPPKSSSVQPDGMTDKLSSVAQTTTSTWCNRLVQCDSYTLYMVYMVSTQYQSSDHLSWIFLVMMRFLLQNNCLCGH